MTQKSTPEWTDCPAGALERAVRRASRRERMRRALPGAAAIVAVVGLALFWLTIRPSGRPAAPSSTEYYYGGIACSEVVRREQDYVSGALDAETRSRIDEHLEACPKCRRVYESADRRDPIGGIATTDFAPFAAMIAPR